MCRLGFVVSKFRGDCECGFDFRAHRKRMHVAVKNRTAFGSNVNRTLLLAVGAGQKIAMPDKLEIAQTAEDCRHPKRDAACDDQQPKLNAIFLHLSRPDIVPAKLDLQTQPPAWSGLKEDFYGIRGACE